MDTRIQGKSVSKESGRRSRTHRHPFWARMKDDRPSRATQTVDDARRGIGVVWAMKTQFREAVKSTRSQVRLTGWSGCSVKSRDESWDELPALTSTAKSKQFRRGDHGRIKSSSRALS